ncbi:MAG TPA: hypothetical protein ENF93_02240, partial [Ignisphaera sp.]|nr:hypothetical protein [Ignisphaera sp.]
MKSLRVGIYNLTGCEGCSLQLLNTIFMEEEILEHIDVFGHLIDSDKVRDADVAFIDGAIVTKHDEELVKEVRKKSKLVVALGTCASIGGINAMAEILGFEEGLKTVYIDRLEIEHLNSIKPLDRIINIDYVIPGCPPNTDEIKRFLMSMILNKKFILPDSSVCAECRALGLRCFLKRGLACLGVLTRAGCNAQCVRYGLPCWGCRGLLEEITMESIVEAYRSHNITIDEVRR